MQRVFNKFKYFEPEILEVLSTEPEQQAAEQAWLDANHGKPGCVNIGAKSDAAMWGRRWSEQAIRDRRKTMGIVELTIPCVTDALLAYYAEHNAWPTKRSEGATEYFGHKIVWQSVDTALADGNLGLPGGSSLAKLCKTLKPDLTVAMILAAAMKFNNLEQLSTHKHWPQAYSARATECFGFPERWLEVDAALKNGTRGLPGGQTLAGILKSIDGTRKPDLTETMILEAAKKHYTRTGRYPVTGTCQEAADIDFGFPETWAAINMCLLKGSRGLVGGSCLLNLLRRNGLKQERQSGWVKRNQDRGLPYPLPAPIEPAEPKIPYSHSEASRELMRRSHTGVSLPEATKINMRAAQLARWAEIKRTRPPKSEPVKVNRKDNLLRINIEKHGPTYLLTEDQIVAAALVFRARTGKLPHCNVGDATVDFGFTEDWNTIDHALRVGSRGLPNKTTLSKLLKGRGIAKKEPKTDPCLLDLFSDLGLE